jgi:hypothetical protein
MALVVLLVLVNASAGGASNAGGDAGAGGDASTCQPQKIRVLK